MKKLLILIFVILIGFQASCQAEIKITSENNKFGLSDNDNVIVKPIYNKIIRLGECAFIVQKKVKFGIINNKGEVLVPVKYRHVERVLGKYAKLGNFNDFGLYDETGFAIIPPVYDSIDLLFGGMFLTYRNYKYGITDSKGKVLLDNLFDDIYMPKPNIMRLQYKGQWYEIEQVTASTLTLPDDVKTVESNPDYKVTSLMVNTGVVSGYSFLTFSDYLIKLISSISPAHEDTIDELMLSQGADTVNILIKFTWLPKYPLAYARNYYKYIRNPNSGPLSEVRQNLINKIKRVDDECEE